ncbi:hypothetical protein IMSAG025_02460 [Muribaculaceae bacterium]|nr:hypothetical protein IMSAG025_02460 [Muribaculaceae bacterium]
MLQEGENGQNYPGFYSFVYTGEASGRNDEMGCPM